MGELIGHLHPLIVHLPIGILSLAFLIEIAGRKKRWSYLHQSLPFILIIALLSSLLSVATGWLIPKEGIYNESLLSLHFWFAVGLTVSIAGLYYLNQTSKASLKKLYFPAFILSMILLTLTGHYGGSMTHGSDYLWSTSKETTSIKKVVDVNTLAVYTDIIKPILQSKCYKCHNDEKQKGKLNMSNVQGLMKGGEGGVVLIKGRAEESTLLSRIHLPIDNEEHMPPEGKPQLDRQEIRLIEWWINEGADFESKAGVLNQSKEITNILEKYKDDGPYYGGQEILPIATELINKIKASTSAKIISSNASPLLAISFRGDSTLTSKIIKSLKPIKDNINELDLSGTNTDDNILAQVRLFKNLQKLKLGNTKITSNGLKVLKHLPYLTSLDIHNTHVNNSATSYLSQSANLTQLFAWQTNLTQNDIADLTKRNDALVVNTGIEKGLFNNTQLLPPTIVGTKDIFKDSVQVSLKYNFNRADLMYTLDGSIPDINSNKYAEPFIINQTANVRASAFLDGWEKSTPSEKTFIKATYTPVSANISSPPSDQYKANGSASLIDFKKGSSNFTDGLWLGYQAKDLTVTLDLGSSQSIQNIAVGALESTASYIFFPKKIIVQSSKNNTGFTEIKALDIPIAQEDNPSELKSFLLSFNQHDARYIKVIIKGILRNPDWHPAPGAKSWIFIDEILVN